MAKKVLIDLYMLKYPHCGFGQIAWNLARYFRDEYEPDGVVEYTLLVPSRWVGAFGTKVRYERAVWYKKFLPFLSGRYDLWHSTDQIARFRPFKGTAVHV
ncbi:MAG: glycosyltransferase family 1 protein, partial [Paludibacteraceae bacterium]|nr:glycosyltransferase family 1 protein [Paludibacteraceae bacterium]